MTEVEVLREQVKELNKVVEDLTAGTYSYKTMKERMQEIESDIFNSYFANPEQKEVPEVYNPQTHRGLLRREIKMLVGLIYRINENRLDVKVPTLLRGSSAVTSYRKLYDQVCCAVHDAITAEWIKR